MDSEGQSLHTFRAPTLDEAYRAMRRALGDRATVVRTAETREGGFLGLFGKPLVELVASTAPGRTANGKRRASPAERRYLAHSQGGSGKSRAESASPSVEPASPSVGSRENVNETIAYFQQLVSDAQKRMGGAGGSSGNGVGNGTHPPPRDAAETPRDPVETPFEPLKTAEVNGNGAGPFRKAESNGHSRETMREELHELRDMLQILLAESHNGQLPRELTPAYRQLVANGMSRASAATLVNALAKDAEHGVFRDPRVLRERLKVEIRRSVKVTGGLSIRAGSRRTVALVGATGVGKTTNLVKLAAHFSVKEGARVALITTDTYRFAAPDQLRVYANIIGVPMEVVNTPKELTAAIATFRSHDLVLIDTAGGSQFNRKQIEEQRDLLAAAQADDVFLVMSANTQAEELRSVVDNLRCINPTALLFTKLDETRRYGTIFSLAQETELPLSYFSTGQNVPDDLLLAQGATVANLVLEGNESRDKASPAFA